MKNMSKKGFTVVELVIVIAVIAVLAAVLIPTFSNLVKKANESAYLQERTNQQIADLAEKVEKLDYLTWEDFEAKLAEEIAKNQNGSKELVAEAVKAAIQAYKDAAGGSNTGLTEDQVKKIVEKALEGSLTTAQVEAIVNKAVESINNAEGGADLTEKIKEIIDDAMASFSKPTGITKEEMAAAIKEALGNQNTGLDETTIQNIVNNALAGFGSSELTKEDIQEIIDAAIGGTVNEVGLAGGSGTAEDPYRVANQSQWNTMAQNAELMTSGKYFKITTDVTLDSTSTAIENASGTFDFDGNTLTVKDTYAGAAYVNSCLFNNAQNATISNLNVEMEKPITLVQLFKDNLSFENVSFYGDVEVSGNNSALFAGFVSSPTGEYTNISFENCNNYANLTGTNMVGVYMGRSYQSKELRVSMVNCSNYGSIISTGSTAAMILGNPSHGGSTTPCKIYAKNVKNYGLISGYDGGALVASKIGKAGYFEFTEAGITHRPIYFYSDASFENLIVDGTGNRIALDGDNLPSEITGIANFGAGTNVKANYKSLSVNDNGTFNFTEAIVPQAVNYTVRFNFKGVHGNANGGSVDLVLDVDDITSAEIYAYEWLNAKEVDDTKALPAVGGTPVENEYGCLVYGNNYVFHVDGSHLRTQPQLIVYAIDADGNIINVATYEYPAN